MLLQASNLEVKGQNPRKATKYATVPREGGESASRSVHKRQVQKGNGEVCMFAGLVGVNGRLDFKVKVSNGEALSTSFPFQGCFATEKGSLYTGLKCNI